MKILKTSLLVVLSFVLIGGGGYLYASSGVKSKPGYAELAKLAAPEGKSVDALLSLNLGPRGVKPVRWVFEQIAKEADGDLDAPEKIIAGLFKDLQGIQLRIYEVDNNRSVFDSAITDSAANLRAKSWEPLIKVRDGDEHVVIMQYGDDELITGLSVMASTSDNAVFLNLMGPFKLNEVLAIAGELN